MPTYIDLYRGIVPATNTTFYTVPAGSYVIVKQICVTEYGGTTNVGKDGRMTLVATNYPIMYRYYVPPLSSDIFNCSIVLPSSSTMSGYADLANTVYLSMYGVVFPNA